MKHPMNPSKNIATNHAMPKMFQALFFSALVVAAPVALAQGFSALISPPRIETGIKPDQTTRQVLEITQVGPSTGRFRIYTSDWVLNASGGVDFSDELKPGSCRPWVALERREMTVPGNGKARFRFEITPPADAPATQCRFAIMFEGLDAATASSGNGISFPVSGRIGVIVYATMAGTKPELKIVGQYISNDAARLPTLEISNSGTAHGRVQGLLSGVDAKDVKLEFTPSTLPVLPGETRKIALLANIEGGAAVTQINYPVTIKGALEWDGQRVPFEHTFKAE
jgi:hypothetical protein